jgi:chromosome segregation ATPase
MKKLIFIALMAPFLFACNGKKKEFESLQSRYDSLLTLGFTKDTTILDYLESFNAIQANLDSIKQAEMIITQSASNGGELETDQKEQINRDINMIYEMLQKNKQTIAELKSKLKKSNAKVASLEQMIERMSKQIEEKDGEIAQLREQLEKMNIQIEILNTNVENLASEGSAKSQTIREQTETINTAYYVIGTKKELLEQKIITIEGGFAGIGRNKKLKEDFNRDYFTRIDITKLSSIPVLKKKANIITTHPSQSYKLYGEKTVDSLVIINAKDFWAASKYLVIIVD